MEVTCRGLPRAAGTTPSKKKFPSRMLQTKSKGRSVTEKNVRRKKEEVGLNMIAERGKNGKSRQEDNVEGRKRR